MKTDLSTYDNSWYAPGAGGAKRILWYYVNAFILNTSWLPVSAVKVFLLRLFGARVGSGVTIKPSVNIKYPWRLSIGNHVWIGENVWIDNLALVTIGDNCCLSQGSMLLTGNHNFKLPTFDLIVKEITLEDGVWVGAKSIICPGVHCGSHSVLTVGAIASSDLKPYGIYRGDPATFVKERVIGLAVPSARD
jgi:putative colanic acid biosynthesis acetyltransferase WcaF